MKKNVASQKVGAQLVSATDGSAFTGSVTVYVTGDAGTQAAGSVGSGACTHEGNGYHTYAPAQAETNYDLIAFTFVGTGAVPVTVQVYTGFPQSVDNATNIAAILADTGTDGVVVASLGASALNAVADAVLDESLTGHYAANSLGARLQMSHSGACQAGGSTTSVVLASGASSTDDYYNGDLIFGWVTADRTNFFADYISDYTGSTRTATVTGIPVSPDATYTYVVVPGGTIPGASAPTAADVADAVWDEALSGHVTTGTTGQILNFLKIRTGTAQAGGASTITLDASASATNDLYNYNLITILAGTGAGQTRQISDYVGSSKVATVNLAWTTTPSSDSVFCILPGGLDAATVAAVADAVWDEARSGHATAGTFGEYVFADATRLSGDATAADNAESFFDGTGYAGTNNVIPTVTTLTGHTPQTGDAYARLGAPAGASVSADVAAVKSETATILADTNELQTDWANGGRLDLILDARASQTTADAIETDTQDIQSRIPSALNNGCIAADVQRVNDVGLIGDGSATPFNVP